MTNILPVEPILAADLSFHVLLLQANEVNAATLPMKPSEEIDPHLVLGVENLAEGSQGGSRRRRRQLFKAVGSSSDCEGIALLGENHPKFSNRKFFTGNPIRVSEKQFRWTPGGGCRPRRSVRGCN